MTVLNPGTREGLTKREKVSFHSGDDSNKNINSFVEK